MIILPLKECQIEGFRVFKRAQFEDFSGLRANAWVTEKELKNLAWWSPRPHGIYPPKRKELAADLWTPLVFLFNIALATGDVAYTDHPDSVSSHIYLFAEPTKVIRKVGAEDDAKALQSDPNNLKS